MEEVLHLGATDEEIAETLDIGAIMGGTVSMKSVRHAFAVMDEVKAKRETVVITKHGEPVAMLVPVKTAVDDIFGFFSNRGRITGDVVSPALSPDDWGELQ